MPSSLNNFKPWLQKISLSFRAKLTDRWGSGRNPVPSLQPDHIELHNWLGTLGGFFCIPLRHLKKATSRAQTLYLMDHSSVPLSQLCGTIAKFTRRLCHGEARSWCCFLVQGSCSSPAALRDLGGECKQGLSSTVCISWSILNRCFLKSLGNPASIWKDV